MSRQRVIGVDACRSGWVGIALDGPVVRGYFGPDIDRLVSAASDDGGLSAVAIDIPIGLPDRGRREADVLARAAVGTLRSSVFMTPVREAVLAPDHAAAVRVNRRLAGEGISVQAYGLRARMMQVEQWLDAQETAVIEVHPEVSFAALAGAPLTARKSTWAGAEQRRRLLERAGISVPERIGAAGLEARVDDVLDAAATAWTARRYVRGQARSLPDPPQSFSDGIAAAIWV